MTGVGWSVVKRISDMDIGKKWGRGWESDFR